MTLREFRSESTSLTCGHCGHRGLVESARNTNNGGIRPLCPGCGSVSPLVGQGIMWLAQGNGKKTRPSLGPVDEFWHQNGDTCAFCGITFDEAVALHIGRQRQHVIPYVDGGGGGPLIPFCARCQEASVSALKRTRDYRRHSGTWREVAERIEKNNPELRGEG